jgi:hypothetical protein
MSIADDGAETRKTEDIFGALEERHIHLVNVPGLRVTRKGRYVVSPHDCPHDMVDIGFHDVAHTTAHIEVVPMQHATSAYLEEFKRDLLYSRTRDAKTGDAKRLITASGFLSEGPVRVISDKEEILELQLLEVIRSIDFFNVRARSKESGLDDAYERHATRMAGLAIPVSLAEARGVYEAIIRAIPRDYSF